MTARVIVVGKVRRFLQDMVDQAPDLLKDPSLDPHDKRLAVEVEDHPLDYGGFEGVIPEGQYGSGTVMIWDEGTWTHEFDPAFGYKKGHLKFQLNGYKLKGSWVLVRTRGYPGAKAGPGGASRSWLLIKHRDDWSGDPQITRTLLPLRITLTSSVVVAITR